MQNWKTYFKNALTKQFDSNISSTMNRIKTVIEAVVGCLAYKIQGTRMMLERKKQQPGNLGNKSGVLLAVVIM